MSQWTKEKLLYLLKAQQAKLTETKAKLEQALQATTPSKVDDHSQSLFQEKYQATLEDLRTCRVRNTELETQMASKQSELILELEHKQVLEDKCSHMVHLQSEIERFRSDAVQVLGDKRALETSFNDLRMQNEKQYLETELLKRENLELKSKMKTFQEASHGREATVKNEINSLKLQITEFQSLISTNENEIVSQRAVIQDLNTKNEEMVKEASDPSMSEQVQFLTVQLESLTVQHDLMSEALKSYRLDATEARNELAQHKNDLVSVNGSHETESTILLEEDALNAISNRKGLVNEAAFESRIVEMESQLRTLEEQRNETQTKFDESNFKLVEHQWKYEELEKSFELFKTAAVQREQDFIGETEQLTGRIADQQRENQTTVDKFNSDISEKILEVETISDQLDGCQTRIVTLESSNLELQSSNLELQSSNSEWRFKCRGLEDQEADLLDSSDFANAKSKLEDALKQNEQLEKHNSELRQMVFDVENKAAVQESEAEALKTQIAASQKEYHETTEKMRMEHDLEISSLNDCILRNINEIRILEEDKSKLELELADKSSELSNCVSDMNQAKTHLNSKIQELSCALDQQRADFDTNHVAAMPQLEAEVAEAKKSLCETETKEAMKISYLEELVRNQDQQMAELNFQIQQLKTEKTSLEVQIKDQCAQFNESFEIRNAELQNSLEERLARSESRHADKIQQSESIVLSTKETIMQLEEELLTTVKLAEELSSENKCLRIQVAEYKVSLESVSVEDEQMRSDCEVHRMEAQESRISMENLASELLQLQAYNTDLVEQLHQAELRQSQISKAIKTQALQSEEHILHNTLIEELESMRIVVDNQERDKVIVELENEELKRELLYSQNEVHESRDQLSSLKLEKETKELELVQLEVALKNHQGEFATFQKESLLKGSRTDWQDVDLDSFPAPPVLIDDPVIQHTLSFWTNDQKKIAFMNQWFGYILSGKPISSPNFQSRMELNNMSLEAYEGFTKLIVPILRESRQDIQMKILSRPVTLWDIRIRIDATK